MQCRFLLLLLKEMKWALGAMCNATVALRKLFHCQRDLHAASLCHLQFCHMSGAGLAQCYKDCRLTAANH